MAEFSPYSPNQQLLHGAITGHWPSIQQALQNGEDINTVRGYEQGYWGLALHMAIVCEHWAVVDRMLDEVPGIDLEVVDEFGETPFLCACLRGNLSLVRKLHLLGCNVHYRDTRETSHGDGGTALHNALIQDYHSDVAEYLLVQCQCDPNIANDDGTLPLDYACSGADDETIHELVTLLLEMGADPRRASSSISNLVRVGRIQTMRLLLDRGARIGNALHHFACSFRGDRELGIQVFQELIGRGANIFDRNYEDPNYRDITPWDLAHKNGNPDNCSLLIAAYVDQLQADHGKQAVHAILRAAVYEDSTQERGFRVPLHPLAVRLPVGTLPFHVFRYLLQSLDPSLIWSVDPDNGSLPIHRAARQNAPLDILRLLVELGPASLRHINNDGELPVHVACSLGENADLKALQFLVDHGGHVTLKIPNVNGALPLHCLLVARGALNAVQFLLEEYPSSVKAKTCDGDLPYVVAGNASCETDVLLLLSRMHPEGLLNLN